MCEPPWKTCGISFRHEIDAERSPIIGETSGDALAQISSLTWFRNARKYGVQPVLVRVRRQ